MFELFRIYIRVYIYKNIDSNCIVKTSLKIILLVQVLKYKQLQLTYISDSTTTLKSCL